MLRVRSWNVNSVRRRLSQVGQLARVLRPDVLCRQETKVADDLVPRDAFRRLGYEHQIVLGQGGYNGVAILSRRRLEACPVRRWRGKEAKRHLSATVEVAPGGREVGLHCFFVPSGGGGASREGNPKYADKLRFLLAMKRWARAGWEGCGHGFRVRRAGEVRVGSEIRRMTTNCAFCRR